MASGTIKAVVSRADVVDNLTTNDATKVLSAKQGKTLSDQIDSKLGYDGSSTAISNLNDVPLNAMGRIKFGASVSPTGQESTNNFICFGLGDNKTIIATSVVTSTVYVIGCQGGTWNTWKTITGT